MIQYVFPLCGLAVCTLPMGFPHLAEHLLDIHLKMHVSEIIEEVAATGDSQ